MLSILLLCNQGPANLLLAALSGLSTQELKRFQWHLTTGWITGSRPIPESQLENADRQDTVDKIVHSYGRRRAVMITHKILDRMQLINLSVKIVTDYRRGNTAKPKHLIKTSRLLYHRLTITHELLLGNCFLAENVNEGTTSKSNFLLWNSYQNLSEVD